MLDIDEVGVKRLLLSLSLSLSLKKNDAVTVVAGPDPCESRA